MYKNINAKRDECQYTPWAFDVPRASLVVTHWLCSIKDVESKIETEVYDEDIEMLMKKMYNCITFMTIM